MKAKRESVPTELPTPTANLPRGTLPSQSRLYAMESPAVYVELWAQFEPTKDGKWTMRTWTERADWMLPNSRFYPVKIPVPVELIGQEIVAEVGPAAEPQAPEEPAEEHSRWPKWGTAGEMVREISEPATEDEQRRKGFWRR
jgi:hypothetical protein